MYFVKHLSRFIFIVSKSKENLVSRGKEKHSTNADESLCQASLGWNREASQSSVLSWEGKGKVLGFLTEKELCIDTTFCLLFHSDEC